MKDRDYIRRLLPDLHAAAEHHAVNGVNGMSAGDIIAYRVNIEWVEAAIRSLREFQVTHDNSPQTKAVRSLLNDRFPADDEHS